MDLSASNLEHIFATLARGLDAEVAALIWGNARLSESQKAGLLALLNQLRIKDIDTQVRILDAGYQEPFWLMVVALPSGRLHPLLLAPEHGSYKIAGFVLPWNEITFQLSQDQIAAASRLAAWWAIKLKELGDPKKPA